MVCNLLGLEEQSRRIDEQLKEARAAIEETESVIRKTDRSLLIKLDKIGLSRELYAKFKQFCESLQPKRGMRGGFSITCDEDHGGSYVLYDPGFRLFKAHVEFDYKVCNWRCQATKIPAGGGFTYVVEFWPLVIPEALEDDAETWGRLHVSDLVVANSESAH